MGWVAGEQVGIRPTAASAVTGRRGGGGGSCCAIFVRVRAARGQSATKKLILRLLKSGKLILRLLKSSDTLYICINRKKLEVRNFL